MAVPPRIVRNAEVYALLFGAPGEEVAKAALAPLGLTPVAIARTYGLVERHWTHTIGSPADHGEMTSLDLARQAAAAVVLVKGRGALLGAALGADGRHAQALMVPGLYPPTPEAIAAGDYELAGDLEGVSGEIRTLYPLALTEALGAAGLGKEALDLVIPHQPSLSIIRRALRDWGIPRGKAFVNVHRYGNMGGASILSGLHEARLEGRMPEGITVGLAVVGGGLTYAGAILRV